MLCDELGGLGNGNRRLAKELAATDHVLEDALPAVEGGS